MFARLFAEGGLSLDRLRALVEVGAAGGIARAAQGDPIKQSQYSRQIKELEDFFQARLVERQGQGLRLTPNGRELARISRFFLLGLSNFQRGCLAEEQTFRIGAGATFIEQFLVPVLAKSSSPPGPRYAVEFAVDREVERRLHDLTLDFGVITAASLSRPLQLLELGEWHLCLWVPRALGHDEARALRALEDHRLPLAVPSDEVSLPNVDLLEACEPRLRCTSFLEARVALEREGLATLLPHFLVPGPPTRRLLRVEWPDLEAHRFQYRLAWNPRLLRLNPHARRRRDFLVESLSAAMRGADALGHRPKGAEAATRVRSGARGPRP
jgi:DNA-binding transcriptional LysR family regulator